MADTVIKNSKMVFPEGIIEGGVAIVGEKIVVVANNDNLPAADNTIDAKGKYLIPGVIDPHVHLAPAATPGYAPPGFPVPELEDSERMFEADCKANSVTCARTGVTTYGHFIHSGPKQDNNIDMFKRYKGCVERAMMTDMFFHAIISNDGHIEEIPKLAEVGITSVKVMYNAYKGPDGMMAGLYGVSDEQVLNVIEKVAEVNDKGYLGAWVMFHAENQDIIYKIRDHFKESGRNDLAVWSDSRPKLVELEMMRRMINMVKAIKIIREPPPLYVCHMSLAEDVDIVAATKAEGEITIACETGPNWLLLTKDDDKLGSMGKVNPPLRSKEDCEGLWNGLRQGLIECIGTDSLTSMVLASKSDEIWKAMPGFPGEGALPLLLSEGVNKGRISFPKLVEVMCTNPARVFGLYPRKGAIAPGSDADLVIVDLDKKQKINKDTLQSPAEFSCFDGWELTGWPITTMVRGQIVFDKGEVVGKPGTGKYLPRTKA